MSVNYIRLAKLLDQILEALLGSSGKRLILDGFGTVRNERQRKLPVYRNAPAGIQIRTIWRS